MFFSVSSILMNYDVRPFAVFSHSYLPGVGYWFLCLDFLSHLFISRNFLVLVSGSGAMGQGRFFMLMTANGIVVGKLG